MNWKEHLIVYVDDEFSNRLVFEQSFGARFRVKAVGSGAEALELLKTERVAAILTDQRMPEMSGHELLTRVKALYPDTIRMVVTAYSDYDPILRAVNEGLVARYLIKPWDRAELESMMRWAIEVFSVGSTHSELQLRLMHTERLATLGTLSSAMLHDFRQPLSHLSINVQRLSHLMLAVPALGQLLAAHGPDLSAEDRTRLVDLCSEFPDTVEDLRASAKVMADLTAALNQYVNPAKSTDDRAADPLKVIHYSFSVCREPAVRARAVHIYDGPAALPKVRIGTTELSQVFINLVANATQALLRQKKFGGRVVVGAVDEGTMVRFVVSDDGPGMSEEVLAKVGTPFFSTRPEGTGIGVSQCRRFVEGAGGKLSITSSEGAGTMVSFTLPKCPPTP